ncbi:MAG: rhodanese-like domain-containing protein [Flavobacteriaceae bacterium]
MIPFLKNLIGLGSKIDYKALVNQGAEIIDVRTKGEFASGHIKGSKNIPLNTLNNNLKLFKDKEKTYLLCCASGMRSGSAKSILKSKGYSNVHNAGSWQSLNNKL